MVVDTIRAKEFSMKASRITSMGQLFSLAKANQVMSMDELKKLLQHASYESRMGAICIMDFQARNKRITTEHRKELYDLYISHHAKYIDTWDMVDRGAAYIVGGYLHDRSRTILYKLAKSQIIQERRTSIVATYYFIRQNDLEDTFKIGEILVHDKEDSINKAVGSWIREAGKRDQNRLFRFLDKYAATMPRATLRYATEKLDKKAKAHYMGLSKTIHKS